MGRSRYRLNGKKLAGVLITVGAMSAVVIGAAILVKSLGSAAANVHTTPPQSTGTPQAAAAPPGSPSPDRTPDQSDATRVIVVDAGHGGFDPGCVGAGGTYESEINLAIAKLVKAELETQGMCVVMTRGENEGLGTTQNESLQERGRIICEADPDMVVSIHLNSFGDPDVSGPLVLFMPGSETGKALAETLQDALNGALEADGTARSQELAVLKYGDQPSALVECGYLSNEEEERLLCQPDYQQRIAEAIREGIQQYFSQEG
jgi:N-acetylmuramoyl-L-alanine amidase